MRGITRRSVNVARGIHTGVRPFDDIPGPRSYPLVGTLLNYLPVLGKYKFKTLHVNGYRKYLEFGPIVREEIVPGINVVWLFQPEDVQELFRREGRHPQRRSHLALEHYRTLKPEVYNTGGLLPTNGAEWSRLRKAFQKGLSSPQAVRRYLPKLNEVIDEFVRLMNEKEQNGDFIPYLSRVYLEMLGLVAFDRRLHALSPCEMTEESTTTRLIKAAMDINSCILNTDNGMQLWRHFRTPMYKKLTEAHQFLESIAVDLIREKQEKLNSGRQEESILESYLTTPDVDWKDVVGMTTDMLLAGIDTTTYSTAFALYHLAKNPAKQRKLFEESQSLLREETSEITPDVLSSSHYLKAAVKESLRLNPISVGIGRILTEDAVFSNYRVPKGCVVVTQNQVMCRFPEFFIHPDEFHPERWLKDRKEAGTINPYLVLPFGHGPRTCIARRLAEQNMHSLILKLCRSFELKWNGGELEPESHLINKPNGPLLLQLAPRSRTSHLTR